MKFEELQPSYVVLLWKMDVLVDDGLTLGSAVMMVQRYMDCGIGYGLSCGELLFLD